jgi:hypothetical protein
VGAVRIAAVAKSMDNSCGSGTEPTGKLRGGELERAGLGCDLGHHSMSMPIMHIPAEVTWTDTDTTPRLNILGLISI